jgi:predicted nucleic acid-binding protein
VRLARWRGLPYTKSAIAQVAQLKAFRLNVRLPDLCIAAIAPATRPTVITRNRRDFGRVAGLSVQDRSVSMAPAVGGCDDDRHAD